MIYIVGSKLLGLSNSHDVDYVCLSSKEEILPRKQNDVYYDCRANSKDIIQNRINNFINFKETTLGIYQFDYNIIQQEFPIEFHILKYRKQIIYLLKHNIDKLYIKTKQWYHIFYLYYILLNNCIQLTEQQRNIVQKAHDRKLDTKYINELKTNIYKLKL